MLFQENFGDMFTKTALSISDALDEARKLKHDKNVKAGSSCTGTEKKAARESFCDPERQLLASLPLHIQEGNTCY